MAKVKHNLSWTSNVDKCLKYIYGYHYQKWVVTNEKWAVIIGPADQTIIERATLVKVNTF